MLSVKCHICVLECLFADAPVNLSSTCPYICLIRNLYFALFNIYTSFLLLTLALGKHSFYIFLYDLESTQIVYLCFCEIIHLAFGINYFDPSVKPLSYLLLNYFQTSMVSCTLFTFWLVGHIWSFNLKLGFILIHYIFSTNMLLTLRNICIVKNPTCIGLNIKWNSSKTRKEKLLKIYL